MLIGLLAAGIVGYAAVVALMAFKQRSLMYFPDAAPRGSPTLPGVQVVRIATVDGERLVGWYLPPRPGRPVILHFGGNGEGLADQQDRWRRIAREGVGFLAIGYRGYAGSSGHPTEAGLHQDARAAYGFLAQHHPPSQIVIWGHSLGSGVAVRLAVERPAQALVLEAPFRSAVAVAADAYPWLPVRLLMRDQFRSDLWIGKLRMPLLVVHGDRDAVIPIESGRSLFQAAPEPKSFVTIPGGGHDDLTARGVYDQAWRFLKLKPLSTAAPIGGIPHLGRAAFRSKPCATTSSAGPVSSCRSSASGR